MDVRKPGPAVPAPLSRRLHSTKYWRQLLGATAVLTSACALPTAAAAQSDGSVLVDTAIPDNFDRDRNVSVLERPHPDYDPLDIRLGGFIFAPHVEMGAGATNNVYLRGVNRVGDGY